MNSYNSYIHNINSTLKNVLILSFLEVHLGNVWVGAIILSIVSNPLKELWLESIILF